MPPDPARKLSRRQFVAASAGAVAFSAYGTASNSLDASRVTIPGPAGLSPAGRAPGSLRVALLTDVHGPHNWVRQDELVAHIDRFAPHIICVAGDAVDDRGDEPLVSRYGALRASLGKIATLGNWEYQGECDLTRLGDEYRRAGVRLLINERVRFDAPDGPVDLLGLDDWRAGAPDYAEVLAFPPATEGAQRALVVSHCPIAFDAIARVAHRPTVVLSGHTHGGQIAPFGLAVVLPDGSGSYVQGLYRSADSVHAMYVSRGLGNSGPPFRIGARPELALLTI